jgi:two-component system chemotaxis response regulator CheY
MSKRLLIADDALIIREMIKDAATSDGWEIVADAADGETAAALYREHHPDAVTLDLVMPQHDGLYALRQIRRDHPEAKVIIVSALDQRHVLKEAFSLGASDFIVKPFERNALLETLDQAVAS